MSITSITLTLSKPRLIDGWVAAANANGVTPEELATEFLENQGRTYAGIYHVGVWTASAFVLRFTSEEITNIRTTAESDANVADLISQIELEPFVSVDDERVSNGMGYLVSLGLLTTERVNEIMSYQRPSLILE
jgi:hypothetical protein